MSLAFNYIALSRELRSEMNHVIFHFPTGKMCYTCGEPIDGAFLTAKNLLKRL